MVSPCFHTVLYPVHKGVFRRKVQYRQAFNDHSGAACICFPSMQNHFATLARFEDRRAACPCSTFLAANTRMSFLQGLCTQKRKMPIRVCLLAPRMWPAEKDPIAFRGLAAETQSPMCSLRSSDCCVASITLFADHLGDPSCIHNARAGV